MAVLVSCVLVGAVSVTASGGPAANPLAAELKPVVEGVGRVSASAVVAGEGRIYIAEEKHNSTAAQIEIAVMLLRLHDQLGVRDIAIEGLTQDQVFPQTSWFRALASGADATVLDQIAVELLRKGEIGGVELLALRRGDMQIRPTEDPELYGVTLSMEGKTALALYLYKIGAMSADEDDAKRVEELIDQGKQAEAMEYVIGLDPLGREHLREAKETPVTGTSIEEELADIVRVEKRAAEVSAPMDDADRAAMQGYRRFLEAADERTKVMLDATTAIVGRVQGQASVLDWGAAHTERGKELLASGPTYAVLTPLSLDAEDGDLSLAAADRKDVLGSVDWDHGGLGSILDGRRRFPTPVGEAWFRSEAELHLAAALAADHKAGETPRIAELQSKLGGLENVKVDWGSLELQDNGDVMFRASAKTNSGVWVDVWTRCGANREGVPPLASGRRPTLEELLLNALARVKQEDGSRDEPDRDKAPEAVIERITPERLAAFAADRTRLEKVRLSG